MTRQKCTRCNKGFKIITQEGLCMICFKDEYGYWSNEFTARKGRGVVKK